MSLPLITLLCHQHSKTLRVRSKTKEAGRRASAAAREVGESRDQEEGETLSNAQIPPGEDSAVCYLSWGSIHPNIPQHESCLASREKASTSLTK